MNPTNHNYHGKTFVQKELKKCNFLRIDAVSPSLAAPYDGPFKLNEGILHRPLG